MIGLHSGNNISSGQENVLLGAGAGQWFTTASGNVGIGDNAFGIDTGAATSTNGQVLNSVAVGWNAAPKVQNGIQNIVAIGDYAAHELTTGSNSTFVGYQAGYNVTSAIDTTAIGYSALTGSASAPTTGAGNTAVGYQAGASVQGAAGSNSFFGIAAGQNVSTANYTTVVGSYAMLGSAGTPLTGNYNTAFGYQAGNKLQGAANSNTLLGPVAGSQITTGSNNIAVGFVSGVFIADGATVNQTSGTSIYLGASTKANADGDSNEVVIGYNATGNGSNTATLGNTSITRTILQGNVGIGTTTPWAKLSIAALSSNTAPLFTISTSTASATSTAFFIDQNGLVGIGTSSPSTALQVNGVITPNADNISSLGNATYRWSAVYAANGTIQTSDQRLKSNITNLNYGLSDVLKLRPVSFTWTAQPQQGTQLGFIAQEVQPILPETVNVGDDANHTLGLTYTEFIPVVVQAIQQIASVSGAFEQSLIAWLGNASNGIGDLFAKNLYATNVTADTGNFHRVTADELCAGTVCVNQQQLAAILTAAGQSNSAASGGTSSSSQSNDTSMTSDTPPVIQINGDNPATIQVGAVYNDLAATITGPQADLNLGIRTFLNGALVSNIVIDTSAVATDTIDYVVTDQNGLTATSTRTVIIEAASSSPSI